MRSSPVAKGHRYLTVVLNLVSGVVVFVGDGKGMDALKPFWKRLRRARAKIKAVATDLSAAYTRAVRDHLPGAVHVFDHFHVIKLFNEKLSALRRELYHEVSSQEERQVLKGTRWLLLKNPENLDADRDEQQRLEDALRLNEPLALAYYLKEDLRQIWSQPNKRTARRVLRDWVKRARASGLRLLVQFAATLESHQEGILNYYHYPISTGPLEGINNKIKTLKRQAYGFRDQAFFKLKILGLHETKRVSRMNHNKVQFFVYHVPCPWKPDQESVMIHRIHRACQCPACGESEVHADFEHHRRIHLLMSRLDEQQRPWFAALESKKFGYGGDILLSRVTGLHVDTIRRGREELDRRPRPWKKCLQELVTDGYGLDVVVGYYPVGASKWNPVEHRLFGPISINWRGQPLSTSEVLLGFLKGTKGLEVNAEWWDRPFWKAQKVSDQEMSQLAIDHGDAYPNWNDTIKPRGLHSWN